MTRIPLSPTSNMDDFSTRTNGAGNTLFGETLTQNTVLNLAIGGLASLLVLVTIISSFVFPTPPPTALNIFFVVCIIMICTSVLVLIFWYRQGDLDVKFRGLIYYSIGLIILLCLCANLYFHDVGR
ncbi:transmembrane protein 243 [Pimephales promelas]|uniref:transmembrane protein 243 n=1 Tax=Pimephales promelas TaxID=90988 RepID=UPI001955AC8C|nr:transmembrane protein 243 [Pimephales promelas]KAG1936881.1 transmembrane protein [Pimephales promelas]